MGLAVSHGLPHPALEPFLRRGSGEGQEDLLASLGGQLARGSPRLAAGQLAELSGAGRSGEAGELFALFEDEQDSRVNGLQLACALALFDRGAPLRHRLLRLSAMFDWSGAGSLSPADLAMLLQAAGAALRRGLRPPPAALQPGDGGPGASVRELCARAVAGRQAAAHEEVVQWALADEFLAGLLAHFAEDPAPPEDARRCAGPPSPCGGEGAAEAGGEAPAAATEAVSSRGPLPPRPGPAEALAAFLREAVGSLEASVGALEASLAPRPPAGAGPGPAASVQQWQLVQAALAPAELTAGEGPTRAALRGRAWLRATCLRLQAAAAAACAGRGAAARHAGARERAARELLELLGPHGGGGPGLGGRLAEHRRAAEERRSRALREAAGLWASAEAPARRMRREGLRLDGALALLEALSGPEGDEDPEELELARAGALALRRRLSSEVAGLAPRLQVYQECVLEAFVAGEVLAALGAATAAPRGQEETVVRGCCEELRRWDGGAAAAELAARLGEDAAEAAERRWLQCEGALVAHQALARGTGLQLELSGCEAARQLDAVACRRAPAGGEPAGLPRSPRSAARRPGEEAAAAAPTTRLRLLLAAGGELARLRAAGGPDSPLEPLLPQLSRALEVPPPDAAGADDPGSESEAGGAAALARVRALRYDRRVLAAAEAFARALDERPREDRSTAARRVRAAPEHGEAPGQGGALADRLREDLDVATEALGRAERSAELEALGARKRGWAAGALLSEVADACRTLDEAVSFVHVELAALGGAPAEAAAEGGGALPPPLEVRHGPPALPAGAAGQCAVPLGVPPAAATHAQAARVVGTLMVVELARHCAETACSAALQGCARRRAEAMLLEAIAEQHMTEAELPARGTACGASCADVVKAGPPSRASAQSEGPGAAETSTEPSSRASAQIECSGAPAAERRPHPRAATLASGATVAVSETFSRAGAQSVDLGSGVAKAELLSRASSREAPTELPSRAGTRATEAVAEVHYCAGSRCEGPGTDEEDTLGVPEELLSACFAADFGPILEDFAKDPTVRLMAGEAAQLGAGLRAHSALELPAAGPRPPTPEPMGAVPAPSAWWRRRPEGAPATLFGLSPCRRCLAVSRAACGAGGRCGDRSGHRVQPGESKGSAPGDKVAQHAVALRVWLWARAQQSLALGLMRGLGPSAVAHLHLERAQARLLELAWLRTVRRQEAEAALDARLSALRRAARFLGPLGADAAGASGLLASEVALHAAEVRGSLGRAAEAEAASAAAAGARASLAPAGLARGADEGEDEVPQLWGTLRALGLLESACAQHSSRGPGQ